LIIFPQAEHRFNSYHFYMKMRNLYR